MKRRMKALKRLQQGDAIVEGWNARSLTKSETLIDSVLLWLKLRKLNGT